MARIIAHNIVSPLGKSSIENYQAIKHNRSALKEYTHKWQLPEAFIASLFNDGELPIRPGMTRFESLAVESVTRALAQVGTDILRKRIVFILSTTKGNVELLANNGEYPEEREYPASAARVIAKAIGITSEPIVVCNACISGVAAMIAGNRLIESGDYDYAIICGADSQCKFIVSGFQSFKALSPHECKPFDKNRDGLNLGEAAATIILGKDNEPYPWSIKGGVIRNDANHISGPSRTGEGSYRALRTLVPHNSHKDIAFVNVHGTATLYNDEMESIALERAGLTDIPINALKGYYGHTMGAAGIMETILSMCSVDDRNIPATRGFEEKGVSGNIHINKENTSTSKSSFIKLLSGFGGCNAAASFTRGESGPAISSVIFNMETVQNVHITQDEALINNLPLKTQATGKGLLTELYHKEVGNYPKFYKMDCLSKLGFIASELLLQAEGKERFKEDESRAVILFNRSSSIVSDKAHQTAISDSGNFFPSPSVFVYTLPNIVTGEIAIRNKYYGETSLYILSERNEELMKKILKASFQDNSTQSIITGWIDCPDETDFIADLYIIKRTNQN